MNIYRTILITSCAALVAMPAYSGTLVESVNQDGSKSISRFESGMLRADMPQSGSYLILDLKNEKAYVVDKSQHRVMDLSAQMWGNNKKMTGTTAHQPKARLVKQGNGPTIAGFPTMHYKVMVGNKSCGDQYLSSQALSKGNMRELGEAMSRMAQQHNQMSEGMTQDPCENVDQSLSEAFLKHGMPLRSVDKDGTVTDEVKRIQTNVSISADYFQLPKGYPVMTMGQMMQQQGMPHDVPQGMPHGQQTENMPNMSGMPDTPSKEDMLKMRKQIQQQMEEIKRKMENGEQ